MPRHVTRTSFKSKQNIIDLTGQTFGKLTVIGFHHSDRKAYWECLCSCGNIKITRADNLTSGLCRSCGCVRFEVIKKPTKVANSARKNELSIYKRAAQKRNLPFELTMDEFISLIKGDCYYCGTAPSRKITYKQGVELINGIDRVNNLLGYTLHNTVSCCTRCNRMKLDMTVQEFLEYVSKIYRRMIGAS